MRQPWMLLVVFALSCALSGHALGKADGASVYSRCFGCHKSTGEGISGIFPPLAAQTAKVAKAEGGRTYLIDVLLYGLEGEIEVGGKKYNGKMPAFMDQLKDEEIAAVLNHVLASWGNDKMLPKGHKEISAAEVKARRGKKLSPGKVYEGRQKLKL